MENQLTVPASTIRLRPNQWLPFLGAHAISKLQCFFPWIRQWSWYCFRRALLFYIAKYAIDVFFLQLKKRKLGVTYFREIALMHWVPPSMHFDKDTMMRVFIRKCGYLDYSPGADNQPGKNEPWLYGEKVANEMVGDETTEILHMMEAKAAKRETQIRESQAEEMQAIDRVLKNFKQFSAAEVLGFFKVSEHQTMEKGQIIFSADDTETYFYGVVSGEIHLFCDGISARGVELVKVAGPGESIVSILAFLHYFAIGPQKYGDIRLYAVCDIPGNYYRVPISKILEYMESDSKKMYEMLFSILKRHLRFCAGFNDLTGILPRLRRQSYLDTDYPPVDLEPGELTGTPLANEALLSLQTFFPLDKEDQKFCWVGVLDSRTVLLRRFKKSRFAFYLYKGLLACTVSKLRRSYNAIQFYLKEGQMVGWREAVMGEIMDVQFQVADDAKAFIVAIPDFVMRKKIQDAPERCVPFIKKILDRKSLLCHQISYTLRFSHSRAGEAVYGMEGGLRSQTQDTYGYLCLSGRLRFLLESEAEAKRHPISSSHSTGRYGIIEKGDWFGLISMHSDNAVKHHRTVICDRYSEQAIIPRYMVSVITSAFREAAGYQCDYLARAKHRDHHSPLDIDKLSDTQYQVDSFGVHTSRTHRVICVYAASPDIPGNIYCDELARHHTSSAKVVTRQRALEALNLTEFTLDNDYLLAKWLVEKEEKTTVLFLLASLEVDDHWNMIIAKMCDMIQVLVTYSVSHKPSEGEAHILAFAKKARKELVFIHPVVRVTKPQLGPSKYPHLPQGSALWLRPRKSWVQRHHHVRILDSAMKYAKEKDPKDLDRYLEDTKDPDKHSDFARVMRWISGQSVGIVLGGGGAKGASHLGTLHYLRELDVPVDYIAGVSIGSFLGALYAVYENIDVVEAKAKELWENLKNPWRYARDITYNLFSTLFRGQSFNWMINYFFGSIQIEDLYIPYFCGTTDLNDHCSRVHMAGDLWFYVRASMTLTLLFPPQVNPFDNHLLVDGGYSDLVPAVTMRMLGIKYICAINIGDERLMKTFNIGYHVSGFKCLLQSLLPWTITPVPNYFDFWESILSCSARNFVKILKTMDDYCIYVRPNINAYTAMDFQYYDEIKRLGYLSTKFKFGGLHLTNLPVHVIWYLLRFYTYPYVPQSQAQMLQGFEDEDWQFAVRLMGHTQMYQRAETPFQKMNLTPYLTDLMEARPYLERILSDDDVSLSSINLSVPVLENFSRDDERLDLVHALARMKELNYMEDFDGIINRQITHADDFKIRTKVKGVASQTYDLANARSQVNEELIVAGGQSRNSKYLRESVATEELDTVFGAVREAYSIKDLYMADPTLFHAVKSYRRLHIRTVGVETTSRPRFSEFRQRPVSGRRKSMLGMSLRTLVSWTVQSPRGSAFRQKSNDVGKPSQKGHPLEEFRKYLTRADRPKGDEDRDSLVPIVTLEQLRRSYQ